MTKQEIIAALNAGNRVELYSGQYEVIPDKDPKTGKEGLSGYLIRCKQNGHCVGLSGQAETKYENTLNYPEKGFYIVEGVKENKGLLGKKCHIRADKCDNPAEGGITFQIIEDNGDRLLIEPVEWPYYIKPVECILTTNVEIID
jgi:hypothetical protein